MQYKQHCFANLSIGTMLSASIEPFNLAYAIVPWMFAGSFVFSTFMLSPDLDLHHSSPTRNWGYLRKIWWPYSKLFKHRGLSHMPMIGTGTRFAYLCILACLCALVYDVGIHSAYNFNMSTIPSLITTRFDELIAFIAHHEKPCISILAGAAASDLSHLLIDGVGSFLKRL